MKDQTITITITTGNDAFQPDPMAEVGRILAKIADAANDGFIQSAYNDINGNTVCRVDVQNAS